MADRYVYNGGDGTNSAAGWTNAYATLQAAFAAGAAGDRFFVAHDHNQTLLTATTTWTFPGTPASPNQIFSINRAAGNFPPLPADLMKMTNSLGTNGFTFNLGGTFNARGIRWQAGSTGAGTINLSNGSFYMQTHRECDFILGTGLLSQGSSVTSRAELLDCTTVILGGSNTGPVQPASTLIWRNSSGVAALSGTVPTNFLSNNATGRADFIGLDLSVITGPKSLMLAGSNPIIRYINCKIATPAINAPHDAAGRCDLLNCDSSATTYNNLSSQYQGKLTTEAVVVRSGGANDGNTQWSWKVVTTANNELQDPFETFEGIIWNDTAGVSKTLTLHILTSTTSLKDNEIWLEAAYLSSASYPLVDVASDGVDSLLSTGTNQASDTGAAWNTTGVTTPVQQKLEVTFTPQMKGLIRWKVKIAKISATVYICPQAELT